MLLPSLFPHLLVGQQDFQIHLLQIPVSWFPEKLSLNRVILHLGFEGESLGVKGRNNTVSVGWRASVTVWDYGAPQTHERSTIEQIPARISFRECNDEILIYSTRMHLLKS
jgi:hypothetical protein